MSRSRRGHGDACWYTIVQPELWYDARSGRGQQAGAHHPRLREHPHFGPHVRKLKPYEPETWRYRIGSSQFFYEIDDQEHVASMIAASLGRNKFEGPADEFHDLEKAFWVA